jgi:hypothetical protein
VAGQTNDVAADIQAGIPGTVKRKTVLPFGLNGQSHQENQTHAVELSHIRYCLMNDCIW